MLLLAEVDENAGKRELAIERIKADREQADREQRVDKASADTDLPVLIDIVVARRYVATINDYPTHEAAAQALAREFAEVRRIALSYAEVRATPRYIAPALEPEDLDEPHAWLEAAGWPSDINASAHLAERDARIRAEARADYPKVTNENEYHAAIEHVCDIAKAMSDADADRFAFEVADELRDIGKAARDRMKA